MLKRFNRAQLGTAGAGSSQAAGSSAPSRAAAPDVRGGRGGGAAAEQQLGRQRSAAQRSAAPADRLYVDTRSSRPVCSNLPTGHRTVNAVNILSYFLSIFSPIFPAIYHRFYPQGQIEYRNVC